MPNYQGVWSLSTQMQNASDWPTKFQPRALFMAGEPSSGTFSNVIDYINTSTLGDASDFGDLSAAKRAIMTASSQTRAVAAGGRINGSGYDINVIEYVTIASTGNVTDFGDTTVVCKLGTGTGNETRGVFQLGIGPSTYTNVIEYITIASPGNATDFGDSTVARAYGQDSALSSPTRAVFGGGYGSSGTVNTIDYVTIASCSHAIP